MKPSPHTDHLTQAELELLLAGNPDAQTRQRLEQLLAECELSREAAAGYAAVPGAMADLPALKKSIALKSGLAKPVWLNSVLIGGAAVAVAAITYFSWPNAETKPLAVTTPQQPVQTVQTPPAANDFPADVVLTPEAEHFVNPEAKPAALTEKQKPAADTAKISPEPIIDAQPIAPAQANNISPAQPDVPAHSEPQYNAPVSYILDLKVTDFEKYYRGNIEVKELQLPGVPAQFEDTIRQRHDAESSETVREVPAEKFLREGLKAFRDGHYGRCVEKMEVLRKNNPADLNAAFYMGVCYVKLEMYSNALPLLDEVLKSPNNVFHEEAKWYKAQALIGDGQTEEGNELLKEIASGNGFYKQKAAEMLK